MLKKIRRHCRFLYILWTAVLALILIIGLIFGLNFNTKSIVIDIHEHVSSIKNAQELLAAMPKLGIDKIVLLPAPNETLKLYGKQSFTGYNENMDVILSIAKKYPDKFVPFCIINPLDNNALGNLKDCVDKGGKGLKLFNGLNQYHEVFAIPLDSDVMEPIYAYSEDNNIPLIYHVDLNIFSSEIENVLKKHPNMIVLIPHLMSSVNDLSIVERLLDAFPNAYTDISFGSNVYFSISLQEISNKTQKFKTFFNKYSNRILFGSDMALNDEQKSDPAFIEKTINCYKDLIQKDSYSCPRLSDYYTGMMENSRKEYEECKDKNSELCKYKKGQITTYSQFLAETKKLKGLALSKDLLEKIYIMNPDRFLNAKKAR